MPELTADDHINHSNAVLSEFEGLMKGAAGTQFQEFQRTFADARAIAQVASTAAANIEAIRNDELIPADVKVVRLARIEANVDGLVKDLHTAALKRMESLEVSLKAAVLPKLGEVDPTKSLLARQELDPVVETRTRSTSKPGDPYRPGDSVQTVLEDLAAQDTRYAQEVLGAWGRSKMLAAGESERAIRDMHQVVLAKLARQPGGNEQAKAALLALPQVKGRIGGYVLAAQMRMEGTKPKPGLPRNAPDTMIQTRTSPIQHSDDRQRPRFKR
jgi:hypothetical protein